MEESLDVMEYVHKAKPDSWQQVQDYTGAEDSVIHKLQTEGYAKKKGSPKLTKKGQNIVRNLRALF